MVILYDEGIIINLLSSSRNFFVDMSSHIFLDVDSCRQNNGGKIRLLMMLKINVGCLSLASEMNGSNIRLCMTLK